MEIKICSVCKKGLTLDNFYKNNRGYGLYSLLSDCKKCHSKRTNEWRRKNLERDRENKNKYSRDWRRNHPERAKETRNRCNEKLKKDIVAYYSNGKMQCNCCGEQEIKFLTIDHINNDGNEHRKVIGIKRTSAGQSFYFWLKRNNYPKGFQILCYNCNCGKAKNNGICPHKSNYKLTAES